MSAVKLSPEGLDVRQAFMVAGERALARLNAEIFGRLSRKPISTLSKADWDYLIWYRRVNGLNEQQDQSATHQTGD